MEVNYLYKLNNVNASLVEITGYIVIIDNSLFLIDSEFGEDYRQADRVLVDDQNIKYVLRENVLPFAGGDSFVFHKAIITGIVKGEAELAIDAQKILIQERGSSDWSSLNITCNYIKFCKKIHEENEGFNFFNEMGDK